MAKHRKLMPTGAERLIWGFGDGSTMPVIDTPLGRIGAAICWGNYMPMMRMAMQVVARMHGAGWYTRPTDLFQIERPTCANWLAEQG